MTKQELIEAAAVMIGDNVADMSLDKLQKLMTVTQYVTDICLNEIEQRGELTFLAGLPIVPYVCDYGVTTIIHDAPNAA